MQVKDVITRHHELIPASATLREASETMGRLGVRALPVSEGGEPIGLVTLRDLVLAAVAESGGATPSSPVQVRDILRPSAPPCHEDDDLVEVVARMDPTSSRHLLVFDRQERLVGILSLENLTGQAAAQEPASP